MSKILTHHVTKQFEDDGVERLPGECVNALPWRTATSLEAQRYIQPLPEGAEAVGDSEGRWWLSAAWLTRHKRSPLDVGVQEREPEQGTVPGVKKLPGVALWKLANGKKFRGSKQKAEAANLGLA